MANEEAREAARKTVDPHDVMENAEVLAFDMGYAAGLAAGIGQAREAVAVIEEDEATTANEYTLNDALRAIDALGEDDRG